MTGQAQGLRVAVVGATGALGSEIVSVLAEGSLPIEQLIPVATERSLGEEIEFQGHDLPVLTEAPRVGSLDLLILCAPGGVSLEYTREALKASVPCIDASGTLAGSPEVTPRVAALAPLENPEAQPLLVAPPGPALPFALALAPIAREAGLRRVSATALEGASRGGRTGIESLYEESVALFNQDDFPEPRVFSRAVAFDCIPAPGEVDEEGRTAGERGVAEALARVLPGSPRVSLTQVQVPVFVGFGAAVSVETERPLSALEAADLIEKAPGVEFWRDAPGALTLRAVAGRDEVVVGRLRPDPAVEHGLQLWIAADVLRVSAVNAVQLAVARVARHH